MSLHFWDRLKLPWWTNPKGSLHAMCMWVCAAEFLLLKMTWSIVHQRHCSSAMNWIRSIGHIPLILFVSWRLVLVVVLAGLLGLTDQTIIRNFEEQHWLLTAGICWDRDTGRNDSTVPIYHKVCSNQTWHRCVWNVEMGWNGGYTPNAHWIGTVMIAVGFLGSLLWNKSTWTCGLFNWSRRSMEIHLFWCR